MKVKLPSKLGFVEIEGESDDIVKAINQIGVGISTDCVFVDKCDCVDLMLSEIKSIQEEYTGNFGVVTVCGRVISSLEDLKDRLTKGLQQGNQE